MGSSFKSFPLKALALIPVLTLSAAIFICTAHTPARGDDISMKNGQILRGIITEEDDEYVAFTMKGASTRISKDNIKEIKRETPENNKNIEKSWSGAEQPAEQKDTVKRKKTISVNWKTYASLFKRGSSRAKTRYICILGGLSLFVLVIIISTFQEGLTRGATIYLALFFSGFIATALDVYVGSISAFGLNLFGILAQAVGGAVLFFALISAFKYIKGEQQNAMIPLIILLDSTVNAWMQTSFVTTMLSYSEFPVPISPDPLKYIIVGAHIIAILAVLATQKK